MLEVGLEAKKLIKKPVSDNRIGENSKNLANFNQNLENALRGLSGRLCQKF